MSFSMGVVTTLTIVGLVADVGREHIAVATSCTLQFWPVRKSSGADAQYRTSRGHSVKSSV